LMQSRKMNSIGIYTRISRDDNGENFESIENQRDMLLEFASKASLGRVYSVYMDDNISGSEFERPGLERMKTDILSGRINMILMKDLSRLGRNNAKTLQMLDFFEEYGVRVLTADGRYDSIVDNDMVGIETWVNERYVRDISRKIRSSLRFKIQRGEYLGKAPFGYKKSASEKNRLVIDESEAYIVRLIYELYLSGLGYTAISKYLEEKGYDPPMDKGWNRITVRRILCSRVYLGDTVQGVSEKVSFKSKKTRRLPEKEWVVTEGTHDALISREQYDEVQKLRKTRSGGRKIQGKSRHVLSGIISCGGCGSKMYARKRKKGIAYICGNYCRNGSAACSSHFVYEYEVVGAICRELRKLFENPDELGDIYVELSKAVCEGTGGGERIREQLEAVCRQQEILYKDRLEGRISEQLFERMNSQMERRLTALKKELERYGMRADRSFDVKALLNAAGSRLERMELTNEMASAAVRSVTVHDETIIIDLKCKMS